GGARSAPCAGSSWRTHGRRAAVDGLAFGPEAVAGTGEVLGMTHEQQPVGMQQVAQAVDDALLGRGVEVDEHVAAEDGIEGLVEALGQVDQVELPELDERGELGPHADVALAGALAAQQEAATALRGQRLDAGDRIHARAGGGQHPRIDVGRDDRYRRPFAQGLHRGHGDRVRFLAGGRGRAPYPQRPSPLQALPEVIGKDGEMVGLAKERRQVRRQGIGEAGPLAAVVRFEQGQVRLEVTQPELAQATREAAVDHRLLAGCERYARAGMDHRADPLEIPRREAKLALRQKVLHRAALQAPTTATGAADGARSTLRTSPSRPRRRGWGPARPPAGRRPPSSIAARLPATTGMTARPIRRPIW